MRRRAGRALILITALIGGSVGAVAVAPSAGAATITAPTGNPYVVPVNASGVPQAFNVSASGFVADSQVFIEQCDGVSPTAIGWDPTQNCDLGSSPAPAIAAANGTVTFPATDINRAFRPFRGPSPQGLFNCLALTDPSPNNGLPNYTNCKIRVSTNNTAGTSDQVFLNIQIPNAANSAPGFTGTPTSATVAQPYSFTFARTGSPTPTFTMSPTSVAGGIAVSSAGVLSGTPTVAGTFPITVTASNGVAPNVVRNLSLVVGAAATGLVDCGLSGALTFKPLSDVPPKKPKANKVKGTLALGTAVTGASCVDQSPVGATKYPVTAGSVKVKGALPAGSNCSSLATLPITGTSLKVKWQGIKPKTGTLATAGKSVAFISSVATSAPGTYTLSGPITVGSFAGKTLTLTLRTDQTHAARLSQCQAAGITAIGFTGVSSPSSIAVV